jgi:hypothetical protein
MAFFGIGKKSEQTRADSDSNEAKQMKASQNAEPTITRHAKARKRLEESAARVRELETRLSVARWKVASLEARLNAAQEAAVEAVVRGGEPPTFTEREAELLAAQRNRHILEEALARATASLRTAEAESTQAAQADLDERFASTLRQLMQHAAKMAECHERLREIHAAAGGRYSPELLWPAFAPDDYYRQWLRAAEVFLSQSLGQDHEGPAAVNGAGCNSTPERKPVEPAAEHHSAEGTGTVGRTLGLLRPCDG